MFEIRSFYWHVDGTTSILTKNLSRLFPNNTPVCDIQDNH